MKRTEPSVLDLDHKSFEKARPGSQLYEVQSQFVEAPDAKTGRDVHINRLYFLLLTSARSLGYLLGRVITEFEPFKAFQLPLVKG